MGAAEGELGRMKKERSVHSATAHVEATEAIMRNAVLPRVQLAAKASESWGNQAETSDVFQTSTITGIIHVRVTLRIVSDSSSASEIQIIASTKSNVIAIEAQRGHEKRRWPKISLTAEGISSHVDKALHEFLTW